MPDVLLGAGGFLTGTKNTNPVVFDLRSENGQATG